MGTRANDIATLIKNGSQIEAAKLNIGQIGGRRNLIINGAMQVAQRGTSEPGINSSGYYTADRHNILLSGLGEWTQTRETDAPDGFANSLKLECTTKDESPATGDFLLMRYQLEGQDLQHLKKGTSSAESVTASFWVKSNKIGTYVFELLDKDNSNRHINKSFTVDASGTWEYKTITFEGDTTGAFDSDNAASLQLDIWLGGGSDFTGGSSLQTSWGVYAPTDRAVGNVNLADTVGNYFQITGLQLEVGDTATPFEHRSYGEELALCQRYYYKHAENVSDYVAHGWAYSATSVYLYVDFPVTMRATPSAEYSNSTGAYTFYTNGSAKSIDTFTAISGTENSMTLINPSVSGLTAGAAGGWYATSGLLAFDSEL